LKKTNQLIINLLKSLLPSSDSPGIAEVHSAWPIVLGALTAVLSIGLLIALSVRYHFFRCQFDDDDDDDDGFIEDNYIQANEREKAEEEEIQQEDTEDSDDELLIPDTIYVN
uniref:Si:ch211-168b3.2 n=1 Tax=Cyprinus carpio TaxID=7962 RepID=A0A8C1TL27_CYPCA